ncbi:hypothetical protein GOBAR_DD22128 [Gossypium barbadense]|nr:hypothetical protein GOBAR_DD22128 [Gossypium barbadense]
MVLQLMCGGTDKWRTGADRSFSGGAPQGTTRLQSKISLVRRGKNGPEEIRRELSEKLGTPPNLALEARSRFAWCLERKWVARCRLA